MARETSQPIHPDDVEFYNRRRALMKGLRVLAGSGVAAALGSLAHISYQGLQSRKELAELKKSHPEPSQKDLAAAYDIFYENTRNHNQPEEKVRWALTIIDQRKAHDNEYVRRLADGYMP